MLPQKLIGFVAQQKAPFPKLGKGDPNRFNLGFLIHGTYQQVLVRSCEPKQEKQTAYALAEFSLIRLPRKL